MIAMTIDCRAYQTAIGPTKV